MAYCLSTGTIVCYRGNSSSNGASASLSLLTGSRTTNSVFFNFKPKAPTFPGTLLHCAFTPTPLSFSSGGSYFSGFGLGLDMNSSSGTVAKKRRGGFVVRASKYLLCQTKRNRSRKSLARTHGFRKRMSTTSGRAVLKRRREKGRWALCTKTNPCSGKRHI